MSAPQEHRRLAREVSDAQRAEAQIALFKGNPDLQLQFDRDGNIRPNIANVLTVLEEHSAFAQATNGLLPWPTGPLGLLSEFSKLEFTNWLQRHGIHVKTRTVCEAIAVWQERGRLAHGRAGREA